MPTTPAPASITFGLQDTVAVVESPYVPSQNQYQIWPGADRWSVTVELPPMRRVTAMPWLAFLAELKGMSGCFLLGDPLGKLPSGEVSGAPVVSGTNQVTTNTLATRGWSPNVYRLLLPGDYLGILNRLYQVTADVNADGSGNASISIWPSLRDTLSDGTAINFVNTFGVFRLSSNKRQWHASPKQLTQISFSAIEVR
jgi:hypothetical protein